MPELAPMPVVIDSPCAPCKGTGDVKAILTARGWIVPLLWGDGEVGGGEEESETREERMTKPETALAVVEPTAIVPTVKTARAVVLKASLEEDAEQRSILSAYVAHHMQPDVDYGVIPGTKKPTLLKPGAEKLVDLFRCTATFKVTDKVVDWTAEFFHYEFKCRITARDTGAVLAEGVGSANSKEARYRWRDEQRSCPACGVVGGVIKGKQEYGGGWVCFKKKGGCGAKWPDGAQEIEGQSVGRVENDDACSLVNTILKMAKKRALVDGALALARCSDIFTQDLEDGAPREERPPTPKPEPPPLLGRVWALLAAICGTDAEKRKVIAQQAFGVDSRDALTKLDEAALRDGIEKLEILHNERMGEPGF